MIKIVHVRPDTDPVCMEIEDKLSEYQRLVGGYIECVRMPDGAVLVCNEEGRINGLSYNRTLAIGAEFMTVFGDFLLVGVDGEDFCSLDPAQVAGYMEAFDVQNGNIVEV